MFCRRYRNHSRCAVWVATFILACYSLPGNASSIDSICENFSNLNRLFSEIDSPKKNDTSVSALSTSQVAQKTLSKVCQPNALSSLKLSVASTGSGDMFDTDVMSLLNGLAQKTPNSPFSNMVNDLNQNSQKFDALRKGFDTFGLLGQDEYDTLSMMEDVTQVISIGVALFNHFSGESQQPKMNESQKAALKEIQDISKTLRVIYNEASSIPTFRQFDEATLSRLSRLEDGFATYNNATAKLRLIYWMYIDIDTPPEMMELDRIKAYVNTLDADGGTQAVLDVIDRFQERYTTENVPHIANQVEAFKSSQDLIYRIRSRVYEKTGKPGLAAQERAKIKYQANVNDAIVLTQRSYQEGDFYSAMKYADIVASFYGNRDDVSLYYLDSRGLFYDFKYIRRSEIAYLLGIGTIAAYKAGNYTAAESAFKRLLDFQAQTEVAAEAYKRDGNNEHNMNISESGFEAEVGKGEAILKTVSAYRDVSNGESLDVASTMENALKLEKNHRIISDTAQHLGLWMLFIKSELLVKAGDVEAAKSALKDMKMLLRRSFVGVQPINAFDVDYLSAYIRYVQENWNGALFALKLMQKKYPQRPKIYALEEKVHRAKNDLEAAESSRFKYQELMTKGT